MQLTLKEITEEKGREVNIFDLFEEICVATQKIYEKVINMMDGKLNINNQKIPCDQYDEEQKKIKKNCFFWHKK